MQRHLTSNRAMREKNRRRNLTTDHSVSDAPGERMVLFVTGRW